MNAYRRNGIWFQTDPTWYLSHSLWRYVWTVPLVFPSESILPLGCIPQLPGRMCGMTQFRKYSPLINSLLWVSEPTTFDSGGQSSSQGWDPRHLPSQDMLNYPIRFQRPLHYRWCIDRFPQLWTRLLIQQKDHHQAPRGWNLLWSWTGAYFPTEDRSEIPSESG
jgi:hypothetical protein